MQYLDLLFLVLGGLTLGGLIGALIKPLFGRRERGVARTGEPRKSAAPTKSGHLQRLSNAMKGTPYLSYSSTQNRYVDHVAHVPAHVAYSFLCRTSHESIRDIDPSCTACTGGPLLRAALRLWGEHSLHGHMGPCLVAVSRIQGEPIRVQSEWARSKVIHQ